MEPSEAEREKAEKIARELDFVPPTLEWATRILASALAEAREEGLYKGLHAGRAAGLAEAIEWCMAYRRDDGTAQKIEEKLRALVQKGEAES